MQVPARPIQRNRVQSPLCHNARMTRFRKTSAALGFVCSGDGVFLVLFFFVYFNLVISCNTSGLCLMLLDYLCLILCGYQFGLFASSFHHFTSVFEISKKKLFGQCRDACWDLSNTEMKQNINFNTIRKKNPISLLLCPVEAPSNQIHNLRQIFVFVFFDE